jgi:hypothetical protein
MTTFTSGDREEAYKKILEEAPNQPGYEDAVPITEQVNASPPHIVDSGASVMKDEPVAYINVEERKLEWAKPITWHTPTIAQMEKIPLYTHPAKTLTNEEILCLWDWWSGEILSTDILDFADTYKRVLLGEEGLLEWHKEYVKKMNEQYPSGKVTEK